VSLVDLNNLYIQVFKIEHVLKVLGDYARKREKFTMMVDQG
jgi:hypothetical protein